MPVQLSDGERRLPDQGVLETVSAALLAIYGDHYGRAPKQAKTYLNDNVLVCVLQEDLLTAHEIGAVRRGDDDDVLTGRIAFQREHEARFVAAVERLTGRRVEAFLSANQTRPGVAAELFILAR
ncbi:MAG: DUF2294 family protein [Solirubrobacterales bacterium]|nr:DUF2294 family protein [Solirubrobacterales bacterium]